MDYQPLLLFAVIGLVGYVVFHGHLKNDDCWLCPYRGWAFAGGSVAMGVVMSVSEN